MFKWVAKTDETGKIVFVTDKALNILELVLKQWKKGKKIILNGKSWIRKYLIIMAFTFYRKDFLVFQFLNLE